MINTQELTIKQLVVAFSPDTLLYATGIFKEFTLHNQGGIKLPVLKDISLEVKVEELVYIGLKLYLLILRSRYFYISLLLLYIFLGNSPNYLIYF